MKHIIIVMLMLLTTPGWGDDWKIGKLRKCSLGVAKIADYRNEDFVVEGEPWARLVELNWDVDMLRYRDFGLFWDNTVEGRSTESQFRQVGWRYELGIAINRVNVFWRHHSQHVMDYRAPHRFPLRNEYGVEFIWYEAKK